MSASRGLILAAPSSGSGKTTLTLGVLRALRIDGHGVRAAKSGPDYIDPAYHTAASGTASVNLDAWGMSTHRVRQRASGEGLLIVEGAMGLFDGAPPNGAGSTAHLARLLDLPVVLVVDAARMSHSIAPLVQGFARFDPSVRIAGVILNRVGSTRHAKMLKGALAPLKIPVLGAVPRKAEMTLPSRHLGLVQAGEHAGLETFLNTVARHVAEHVDLDALSALAATLETAAPEKPARAVFPRQVAIARDAAFTFVYPHQIAEWRQSGTRISYFSPLADDPVPEADMVFLPGGYPELHADRLAHARRFRDSLRAAADSALIYGECGGYMVLGETLTDAEGQRHAMTGLLGLHSSFADRRLHLGYRRLTSRSAQLQGTYSAHEFHYATTLSAEGTPLFDAVDAEGNTLAPMGLQEGRVLGSFAHIIDAI